MFDISYLGGGVAGVSPAGWVAQDTATK